MSIIVEDGTGLSTAETYISVAGADTYHAGRGTAAAWAALSTPQKEAALRDAADYMLGAYRLRWKGVRYTAAQALDWPRALVPRQDYYDVAGVPPDSISGQFYYPVSPIPVEIGRATAALALKASAGELAPDLERAVRREKVDTLEVEYEPGSKDITTFRAIDAMLAPFLNARGAIPMLRG